VTALVAESWGGYEVSHAVATALARARARAAARGDRTPRASDVAFALFSTPDSYVAAVLTAVGVNPSALATGSTDVKADAPAAEPGSPAPAVLTAAADAPAAEPGSPAPAVLTAAADEHIAALLARADGERRRTNDGAIGSIHLVSALAQFPDAGLAALRNAGIDTNLLRTGVARLGQDEVADDDVAFRPPPAPPVIEAPPTPPLDDLATRTPMRQSATIRQMLNSVMPSGPNATTSPLGKARAERWAPIQVAHQLLTIAVVLLAVDRGVPWWLYPVLLGGCATPTMLPLPVWAAFVVAALVLAPPPLAVTVALAAAAAAAGAWYELWMKRVDLGAPRLTMRDLRRAARATGTRMIRDRFGLTGDE